MTKAIILSGILVAFGFFCDGCATGPRYLYTGQKDSASVDTEATDKSDSSYDNYAGISIQTVDGLTVGNPLAYWRIHKQVMLSPGKHTIALLTIQDTGETDGTRNDGTFGPIWQSQASATGSIDAEFVANHMYRLTASLSVDTFEASLWDETEGMAKRSEVGKWVFEAKRTSGNADFTSAPSQ